MNFRTILMVFVLAVLLVGGAVALIVVFERSASEVYTAEPVPTEVYTEQDAYDSAEVYHDEATQETRQPMREHRQTDLRPEIEFSQGEQIQASREQSIQSARRPVEIIQGSIEKNRN